MAITSTDLVAYHAATQSDQDGVTVGGAIDVLRRPDFTQLAANDTIEVVSSAAGDTTQTVTVTARDTQGRLVSQTVTLNGTTAVAFGVLGTIERVLQAEMSATATGAVTVRRSDHTTVIRAIPVGERGFSMIFRKTSSSVTGALKYYAKYFWKNTNGSNALLSATVIESSDPNNVIAHALATAVNDSGTTTNRQTIPAGLVFDSTAKTVPGTDLNAGATIGVWVELSLAQNNAPIRSTYTPQLNGSTT